MDLDRSSPAAREWVNEAIRRVEADANRSADTHLIPFPLAGPLGRCDIDLYLKDESTHPTGSLKHRLARSLFLYALCNGQIQAGTTVTEASSGSTAISEAYFARMLGLPFIAVMPRSVSTEKIALIEREGGRCHLVDDPTTVYSVAAELAQSTGGVYLDQFTFAERATDWRGNNNIAESIFEQMAFERYPVPRWIVVGAGTGARAPPLGATSATAVSIPPSLSSTRRIRRSITAGARTTCNMSLAWVLALKASAGLESSRAFCRGWSIA